MIELLLLKLDDAFGDGEKKHHYGIFFLISATINKERW